MTMPRNIHDFIITQYKAGKPYKKIQENMKKEIGWIMETATIKAYVSRQRKLRDDIPRRK